MGISENTASANGGGIGVYSYASPSITNCTISNNTAYSNGGGIYCC
jgi:parallel beta-helix repeat protein